jgi:hypothetical protein
MISINHLYFLFSIFINDMCSVINYVPDVFFLLMISKFSCCKCNLWLRSPAFIHWNYALLERVHCNFTKHSISKTRVITLLPKTNTSIYNYKLSFSIISCADSTRDVEVSVYSKLYIYQYVRYFFCIH